DHLLKIAFLHRHQLQSDFPIPPTRPVPGRDGRVSITPTSPEPAETGSFPDYRLAFISRSRGDFTSPFSQFVSASARRRYTCTTSLSRLVPPAFMSCPKASRATSAAMGTALQPSSVTRARP